METYKNIFESICENKCDAQIMQVKSHLLIILMSKLNGLATKRKDMAKILGCSNGEMSRIANGYLSSISIEKLIKHLSIVGISLKSYVDVESSTFELKINDRN